MKPGTIKAVLFLVLLVSSIVIVIVVLNQQIVARDREVFLATSSTTTAPTPPVSNSTTSVTIETDGTETTAPEPFPARFISSVVWPPVVATTKINPTQPLSCTDSNSTKRRIQGREYCITVTTEGAAGSIYKNFTYVTQTESLQTTATFVLRFPNCQNYDSPDSETCTAEQINTDIDSLVDNLIK